MLLILGCRRGGYEKAVSAGVFALACLGGDIKGRHMATAEEVGISEKIARGVDTVIPRQAFFVARRPQSGKGQALRVLARARSLDSVEAPH